MVNSGGRKPTLTIVRSLVGPYQSGLHRFDMFDAMEAGLA